MSSLKEQREQLLQEKMKEMADIGVKKRTAENTPDFDEPIDLDEEILSEDPVSKDVEKEEKTNDISTEQVVHSPKRKKVGKGMNAAMALDFEEYEQRFLTSVRNGRNKSGFSIHTEILQILRDVLSDLRSEASITGYIENILLDHLKTYQDMLNHTASQRRRNKTINL